MAEKKPKPLETDFVSKVVQDPASIDVMLLRGFLGASPEEAHTRLYGDAALSSYLEIPDDAIRHVHELTPGSSSPLGGAFVWVDRGAQCIPGLAGWATSENTQQEGNKMYTTPLYCPIPTTVITHCPTTPLYCPHVTGTGQAVPPAPVPQAAAAHGPQPAGHAHPATSLPGCVQPTQQLGCATVWPGCQPTMLPTVCGAQTAGAQAAPPQAPAPLVGTNPTYYCVAPPATFGCAPKPGTWP